ncbi:hypothetical protein D3C81_2328810 [compost metagenome]
MTELAAVWQQYQEAKPPQPSAEEKFARLGLENTLLKAQISTQAVRSDFIEDVIAELALQVYT